MRRIGISVSLGTILALGMAGSTVAGEPNNQACLGADFSSYARDGAPGPILVTEGGSGFGQFNAALAQAVPGLGLPVQLHLAGFIPDSYVLNSCNNP